MFSTLWSWTHSLSVVTTNPFAILLLASLTASSLSAAVLPTATLSSSAISSSPSNELHLGASSHSGLIEQATDVTAARDSTYIDFTAADATTIDTTTTDATTTDATTTDASYQWVRLHDPTLSESLSDLIVRALVSPHTSNAQPSLVCRPFMSADTPGLAYAYEQIMPSSDAADLSDSVARFLCADSTCSVGCSRHPMQWSLQTSASDINGGGHDRATYTVLSSNNIDGWTRSTSTQWATSEVYQSFYGPPTTKDHSACSDSTVLYGNVHSIFDSCVSANSTHSFQTFRSDPLNRDAGGMHHESYQHMTTRLCRGSTCNSFTCYKSIDSFRVPKAAGSKPSTCISLSQDSSPDPHAAVYSRVHLAMPILTPPRSGSDSRDPSSPSSPYPTESVVLALSRSMLDKSVTEASGSSGGESHESGSGSPLVMAMGISLGICAAIVIVILGVRALMRVNLDTPCRTTLGAEVVVMCDTHPHHGSGGGYGTYGYGGNGYGDHHHSMGSHPPRYDIAVGGVPVVFIMDEESNSGSGGGGNSNGGGSGGECRHSGLTFTLRDDECSDAASRGSDTRLV
ncbi:hypothetical protein BASA50_008203 [Batrachochytrium salamandrivorans]|uniref:Membrane-associated protein n=1 Tax=Batrachochytrium salamandrivorans TaxID=1357716 RepID=A0ABQ8F4V2_9FUNG|nr:hypothetical protein BASA50_008203 [Batrachochytrium salamandrivorans]KAH9248534.1 hypothetical protein BASA81_013789 [Batrachochytrium salamandrivorans]